MFSRFAKNVVLNGPKSVLELTKNGGKDTRINKLAMKNFVRTE